jgi:hypothetical protein
MELLRIFTSVFRDGTLYGIHNTKEIKVFLQLCLFMEGSGSVFRTSNSGSGAECGRSKHLWILEIRFRNTDTKEGYIQCRLLYLLPKIVTANPLPSAKACGFFGFKPSILKGTVARAQKFNKCYKKKIIKPVRAFQLKLFSIAVFRLIFFPLSFPYLSCPSLSLSD